MMEAPEFIAVTIDVLNGRAGPAAMMKRSSKDYACTVSFDLVVCDISGVMRLST
jgi:hypothetical protein